VQAGLDDARDDLHAASQTRRRRNGKRDLCRFDSGLARDPFRDRIGRQRSPLEDQHAPLPILAVPELREQLLLDARLRAQRTGSHGEKAFRVDRPAGVLRRHAALGGMVGPHLDARPRLLTDRQRHVIELAESAHAQLREQPSGREATGHVNARIEHARAAGERRYGEAHLLRVRRSGIGQHPRALVHSQILRHRRPL
jgi:hypothetical protein